MLRDDQNVVDAKARQDVQPPRREDPALHGHLQRRALLHVAQLDVAAVADQELRDVVGAYNCFKGCVV